MALTVASCWALIDGGTKPQDVRMRVTAVRGFWHDGILIAPGETVEVTERLVAELLGSHKAVVATDIKAVPHDDHGQGPA